MSHDRSKCNMKTSVDAVPQWSGLVVNISIVLQSGTGQVSFTNLTHLSSMRISFFLGSLYFFLFFFWRGLPNKDRNAAVLTAEHSEDILVCEKKKKKRFQHEQQVGNQPCKSFPVSVCVVYILYVYVQHMQARHKSHVSVCVINYTSSTLEAILKSSDCFKLVHQATQ